MAISAISNAAAVGNTVTMSTHATGDLILASVWKSGATTAPTIPSGWTSVVTTTGATSWMGIYKKTAASSSETTGTWTGATAVEVNVYRGASDTGGVSAGSTNTGTTITYPAVTLQKTNSTSWVYRTACAKAATNITTNTPTGYTARGGIATTGSAIRGCDSNAGLAASPGTGTQTVSGSGVWIALSVELKVPNAAISTLTDDFNTGSVPDTGKWTNPGGCTLSSGDLLVPAAGSIYSTANYTLVADAVYVQAKAVSAQGFFTVFGVPGEVGWVFNSSSQAQVYLNGSLGSTRTHTSGDWYRVRESGGTVFCDYSTNGTSWTNLGSATAATLTINTANIQVQMYDNSGTGTDRFDNLNTVPAPSNTGAFFFMF
jgi:hypothetical protein